MAPKKNSLGVQKTTEMKKAHGSQENLDGPEWKQDFEGAKLRITLGLNSEQVGSWMASARKKQYNRFLAINSLSDSLVVGISFGGDEASVSTITLSSGRDCLIIPRGLWENDPFKTKLKNFFSDDEITFVGIAVGPHERLLRRSGIKFYHMVDLKKRFSENNKAELSYKEILVKGGLACKFDLNHQVTGGDWGKAKLSKAQIRQAIGDSYVSRKIGVKLLNEGTLTETPQGL